MFREVNVNVTLCKMLPLVDASRGLGPLYLSCALSVLLVFRIKQEATTKVSAGFRSSSGTAGEGSEGIFSMLMKNAPPAALDLEVLSLPEEHAGPDQKQRHDSSHWSAWLSQP